MDGVSKTSIASADIPEHYNLRNRHLNGVVKGVESLNNNVETVPNGSCVATPTSNGSASPISNGSSHRPAKQLYSWDEIKMHASKTSRWVVIDKEVYDVTRWQKKHPGGTSVMATYAGQDSTEAFIAFHKDMAYVKKFMKPLHIGSVMVRQPSLSSDRSQRIQQDFEQLRLKMIEMGMFKGSTLYFMGLLLHIVLLQIFAYAVLYWSTSWSMICVSMAAYVTSAVQASWLQHDFGHLSVFRTPYWNRVFHYITMGFLKGASPIWWSSMHNRHHSKPNVIGKDPDIRLDLLFVVGEKMPVTVAKERKRSMPFNLQHRYFHIIGPPLLFPLFFQFMTFYFCFTRRKYLDLFVSGLFYVCFLILTVPVLGFVGSFLYFQTLRLLESTWFAWVSQANHLPMHVDDDMEDAWVPMQLRATCNIEGGYFNDWFTGHLNFQVEHHLFPTMPRHNYCKVQPYVKQLCQKYDIPFVIKPMWGAFRDIIKTLYASGQLWLSVYEAHHFTTS